MNQEIGLYQVVYRVEVMIKVIFIVILLELSSCRERSRNDACYQFNQGYSVLIKQQSNKKDTSQLIKFLNKIAKKDSLCKDIYLTRGDLLLATKGGVSLAKEDYLRCLILDSNNIYSLYKMGILHQLIDEYDSSIYYFQRALKKKSYKDAVINYHSNSNDDLSKYDIDYNNIIFGLGESSYYKGDLRSALINFNICIQNKVFLSKSYLYRGSIHLESNRQKDACIDFNLSVENGNTDAAVFIKKYCNNSF